MRDISGLRAIVSSLFLGVLLAAPARSADLEALPEIPIHSAPVSPDTDSGVIGQVAAVVLEHTHYLHRTFDAALSKEALRLYIDEFDYNHMIFNQADIDEFNERFGSDMLQRLRDEGDVSPAYVIFNRFQQRLAQRVALVDKLCQYHFDFTSNETVQLNRHKAPWPSSDAEATDLWRRRVEYEVLQERLNNVKPAEQTKNVEQRYERLRREISEYEPSDVLQSYLEAMANSLDPHSDYLGAPQKKNFDISMRLSVFGIGAVLTEEDGYAKISSLVPGGPADRSKKLRAGDRIEAVAQGDKPFEEIVGMRLDHAVMLIRGDKGTLVRLKIIPADALDPATRVVVNIVREEVKLVDREAKAKIIEVPSGSGTIKAGVIDLPEFYSDLDGGAGSRSATRDMAALMSALEKKGVQGIVVDIRDNGGGSLKEVVSMAGLFIKGGPVVQVRDSDGDIEQMDTTEQKYHYSGPVIVLVNRGSASASEIFAGMMQDYGRGLIVGAKSTFGKGTVQALVDLSRYMPLFYHGGDPGTLKVTIQKFYRVSGASTQNRGVIPDIHLPSEEDNLNVTESSLDNAMPYDTVPAASYERSTRLDAILPALKTASAARVAASREFSYIEEDGARLEQEMNDKTVSLNLKTRLAEQNADKARDQARDKERLAHPAPEMATIDVSLEDLAGVPEKEPASVAAADDPVAPSTGTVKGDYAKVPPVPDATLDESLYILADMIRAGSSARAAAR